MFNFPPIPGPPGNPGDVVPKMLGGGSGQRNFFNTQDVVASLPPNPQMVPMPPMPQMVDRQPMLQMLDMSHLPQLHGGIFAIERHHSHAAPPPPPPPQQQFSWQMNTPPMNFMPPMNLMPPMNHMPPMNYMPPMPFPHYYAMGYGGMGNGDCGGGMCSGGCGGDMCNGGCGGGGRSRGGSRHHDDDDEPAPTKTKTRTKFRTMTETKTKTKFRTVTKTVQNDSPPTMEATPEPTPTRPTTSAETDKHESTATKLFIPTLITRPIIVPLPNVPVDGGGSKPEPNDSKPEPKDAVKPEPKDPKKPAERVVGEKAPGLLFVGGPMGKSPF
ncbi:hypothetical protein H4R21_001560 [Coemansia helicoidea]|uniref:Uncharacterized protein n=1 Tax=Coemansia helicoidea TaxID=1286919 RepID=A0ACC1LAV6_9FUNG|nr:hypothetical protein H4R21_001560 [Coemansia helicoidea]